MDPKIVIIGAGVAGIAAARKLLERGFRNILVLEAENRIGGRIQTIPFGANVVDLGAQWCHGEGTNAVYQLARQYNLLQVAKVNYHRFDCIQSNGESVPTQLTDYLIVLIKGILKAAEVDFKNPNGISLGAYLSKRYAELLDDPKNSHIDREIASQFLEMYMKFECSYTAADSLSDISGFGYCTYLETEGNQHLSWKNKGFSTLLDILMGKYNGDTIGRLLKRRILLKKKVKKILWNAGENSKVLIKCENEDVIEADHVICTVSLGVLKECHKHLFSPELPLHNLRAIESLKLGTVNKLFLEFEKAFWPINWNGFNLLWSEEDLTRITQSKDRWLEDVFGFYPVDYQPNVLCGWILGENARYVESLPENEILDGLMFLLRKFLGWNVPCPLRFKPTKWYTNSNFRGSYSYFTLKAEQAGVTPADLARPVSRHSAALPVLLFAGEATHESYYSTVHGAIETGWREANRIASFYPARNKSHL
ncbi:unnamed protein product [Hermetia illucens]|uniref:Amine oxidase domain-containing protein n=1 Tax=Hermetia illucens TaxID=343691 RepID=A0A7R8UXX2_HERIL|nr:spermine oxidase-like [Hermetia illucens]CAD7088581.1 unnamed protein product [Hermetia illucens]